MTVKNLFSGLIFLLLISSVFAEEIDVSTGLGDAVDVRECVPVIKSVLVNGNPQGVINANETNNITVNYSLPCDAVEVCFSLWRVDPNREFVNPRLWWLLFGTKNYIDDPDAGKIESALVDSVGRHEYDNYSGDRFFPHNLFDVECKTGSFSGDESFSFQFSREIADRKNNRFLGHSPEDISELFLSVQASSSRTWSPSDVTSPGDIANIPWRLSSAESIAFSDEAAVVEENVFEAPFEGLQQKTSEAMGLVDDRMRLTCSECNSVLSCLTCLQHSMLHGVFFAPFTR